MSAATSPATTTSTGRTVWVGVAAAVCGSALAYYGAYGDPHPKANQEAAVPFLVGVSCVAAALAFALVVPRIRRSGSSRAWGIATGVLAVVLTPVAFWSGVPLVLGAAAVYGGRGRSPATVVLGAVAIAVSLAMTVLGNTVLQSS